MLIVRIVRAACAHIVVTLTATAVLTFVALVYAATHFAMTTNTESLIASTVHWRVVEADKVAAFPSLNNVSLVIIDASTSEGAEQAASALSATMESDHAHFLSVRRPEASDFFRQNGLLFGSVGDVRETTEALIKAQPLLGPLAADPSLRGIAQTLDTIAVGAQRGDGDIKRMTPAFDKLSAAIDQNLAGRDVQFSWQALFGGASAKLSAPRRQLILLQPVLNYQSIKPSEAASRAVYSAAQSLQLDAKHGIDVRVTGGASLSDEEFSSLEENIGFVGLVMTFAMIFTLWLATRSVRIVTAILATIIVGLILTIAAGLLMVGVFNIISVAFIPLFVGLGVDFGIQIAVKFNAERRDGESSAAALERTAAAIGGSLLLAAGAIFLGFGAFLPTAYRGIAELGIIAGLGMIVALGLNLTLLPALLIMLRPLVPKQRRVAPIVVRLDQALVAHRRPVIWLFLVAMLGSIALLPSVQFDFNPLHLRDPRGPAMAALTDLMRDPLRTPNTVDIVASNPASAVAITQRLRRLPEVAQVITLDSFVPSEQSAKLAIIQDASLLLDLTLNPFLPSAPPTDAETVAALSKSAATLAKLGDTTSDHSAQRLAASLNALSRATQVQRAAVSTMLAAPLNTMLDQARQSLRASAISRDSLPDDIKQDWVAKDGRVRIAVFPAGDSNNNGVLKSFAAAVQRVSSDATGLAVTTQAAAQTIAWAFVEASMLALLLVSALLYGTLRSISEVAFTLAPVVLSGFLTLGTCVIIGQPINFANIIAFPLLLGVGVAFHIYFVMAWRSGATQLLQSSLARAVFYSAVATGTAFGALWLSHHPGTASMGKILMISLAWTLVCALIFEPALLGPPRPNSENSAA